MKKVAVIILSLVFSIMAFSQDVQYEDVVYLENGSVIRGMIIEQIPGQKITIQTADRNLFVFEVDQIEKITKEEVPAFMIHLYQEAIITNVIRKPIACLPLSLDFHFKNIIDQDEK